MPGIIRGLGASGTSTRFGGSRVCPFLWRRGIRVAGVAFSDVKDRLEAGDDGVLRSLLPLLFPLRMFSRLGYTAAVSDRGGFIGGSARHVPGRWCRFLFSFPLPEGCVASWGDPPSPFGLWWASTVFGQACFPVGTPAMSPVSSYSPVSSQSLQKGSKSSRRHLRNVSTLMN